MFRDAADGRAVTRYVFFIDYYHYFRELLFFYAILLMLRHFCRHTPMPHVTLLFHVISARRCCYVYKYALKAPLLLRYASCVISFDAAAIVTPCHDAYSALLLCRHAAICFPPVLPPHADAAILLLILLH